MVSIDAQVTSRTSGEIVRDLTHEEVTISENGTPQILASFHRLRAPLSLVILIDSASTDRNVSSLPKEAMALSVGLGNALESGDEVSVLSFAPNPQILQDYTADRDSITAAIERAYVQKKASVAPVARRLRLALERAAEQAQTAHNPEGRRAVILISDAFQRGWDQPLPFGVLAAIVRSRSALFVAGLEGLAPQFVGEMENLNKVQVSVMVGLTGGSLLDDDWKSSLERMRWTYRIAYFADAHRSGELVSIRLELKPSAKRGDPDLALTYPRFATLPHE
jgi:VWFA-related protein